MFAIFMNYDILFLVSPKPGAKVISNLPQFIIKHQILKQTTMYKTILAIGLLFATGCASPKRATTASAGEGDTRTKPIEYLDDNSYLLVDISDEPTYGYDQSCPVKVGGVGESSGPLNERRFLNGLLGPNGEEIGYFRAGSCCPFKTPNGIVANSGMLDLYRVFWSGGSDTLDIYINMYDKGDLKVPVGLTAKKKL